MEELKKTFLQRKGQVMEWGWSCLPRVTWDLFPVKEKVFLRVSEYDAVGGGMITKEINLTRTLWMRRTQTNPQYSL